MGDHMRNLNSSTNSLAGCSRLAFRVVVALILSGASAFAENSVTFVCPAGAVVSPGDSIALKVLLANEIPLNGMSLGFQCKSTLLEITSIAAAPALQIPSSYGEFFPQVVPATNQASMAWLNYAAEIPFAVHTSPIEAFTIWLRPKPDYAGQCVDVDSSYVTGGHYWFFLYQGGMMQLAPVFHDCGTCDVGGTTIVCGDANASGRIDITDVVCVINYIFAGGPAPLDAGSGDFDCNERVAITDAVYLIRYIFAGGGTPCAGCLR